MDLTAKQVELKEAIESRGLKASWWAGREIRLYVERTKNPEKVFLTFDEPSNVFGAKVTEGHPTKRALHVNRIAFYEALRVGNPEELPKYIAECAAADLWDGAPAA